MHDRAVFSDLARQYRDALLGDVLPFWQRHSIDDARGGYYSCLDRAGGVYDAIKYVMMQARQVWMFSALVNRLERRDDWLEMARHGDASAGAPASPSLTLPVILANATLELDGVLDASTVADTLGACLRHVMGIHLNREQLLLHEGAASGGGPVTVGSASRRCGS